MHLRRILLFTFSALTSLQVCFGQGVVADAEREQRGNVGYSRESFGTDGAVLDRISRKAAAAREEAWDGQVREDYTVYSPGSIPITEDVSPSGARVYNIPIRTASGWKLAPGISLTYNSQAGNGVAGYGWELGGLSSIRVRSRNYYYDGAYESPIYNSTNAVFSLDGVPLVQSEGTVSGYTLESSKGHIQVKKHTSSSGAVLFFTALYPNGTTAIYGYEDGASPRSVYPLTSLTDIDGNSISFTYSLQDGNYYITRADYGSDASLEFGYQTRSDMPSYRSAFAGELSPYPTRLLKSITSRDGVDTLCHYTLVHSTLDGVSLLKEIHCASGGSELYPLTFTFGTEMKPGGDTETFVPVDSCFFQNYHQKSSTRSVLYRRGRMIPGNPSDDIVSYPEYNTYTKTDSTRYRLRWVYKYDSAFPSDTPIYCDFTGYHTTHQSTILAGTGFQTIEALDVDGDGIDEMVKVNNRSTTAGVTEFTITVYSFDSSYTKTSRTFTVSVNAGTSNHYYTNPARCFYKWGNFRGDGRPMLLILTRQSSLFALIDLNTGQKVSESSLFTMSDAEAGLILAADIEGDGQDDLCHVTDTGIDVYSLAPITGTSFSKRTTYYGANKSSLCCDPQYGVPTALPCRMDAVDLNGDGYREIVSYPLRYVHDGFIVNPSTVNVAYFNGASFYSEAKCLLARSSDEPVTFLDADKDGLPDMLQIKDGKLYFIPNVNGAFSVQSSYTNVTLDSASDLVPGSMSLTSSFGDILVISGRKVTMYKFGTDHGKNRLVYRMRNLPGLAHESFYSPAGAYEGAYLEDSTRTYSNSSGFRRMLLPLTLLESSRTRLNAEIIHDEYYTYWDAVISSRGLGFCGFGKVRSLDYNDMTYNVSVMDPERFGIVTESALSKSPQGNPYHITTNTYDSHSTTYGKFNPRLTASVSTDNLTGITTTTNITYGAYDFPITVNTARRIGSGEVKTETVSRTYQHSTSPSKYILGSVTGEDVQLEGDGSSITSWRRRTAITYDSSFRPLTRKFYTGPQPDSVGIVSETRWQYDSHGNVISEETAPYGATTFTGTSYTYGSDGRYVLTSTDELGRTTTFGSYNKFGKPATVTDYSNRTTTYTYDPWGNVTRAAYPDGGVDSTIISWGGSRLYTVTRTSTGKPSAQTHYDALGREVRTGTRRFDGQWQWRETYYGVDGRIYQTSLPFRGEYASSWNNYSYDTYGRPTRLQEPSGKVTTWSYSGTSTTTVKEGITSTSTTDAAGNVVSVTDGGGTIIYTLRDDSQPSSITAGGVTTTITYDNYGRRILLSDPGAGTYADTCAWNADGSRAETHTGPNGTAVSSYDRYGRITSVIRQGEFSTSYAYDNYGRLVSETSTNGTMTGYTYDSLDRVATRRETVPDGKWLQSTYTYGPGSVLSSVQYSSNNGTITTEYLSYANGHNTGIALSDSTLVWQMVSENELGLVTEINTGTINREYGYTAFGLPTFRKMNGGALQNFTYQFDASTGNLLSRQDQKHSTGETFGYDALNRLTAIGSRQIGYADNGNITSIGDVGIMSYGDATNPYLLTSLLPDSGGAGVPMPRQTVSYNSFDRPATISQDGTTASLIYNGSGERVKMTVTDNNGTLLTRHYIGGRYEVEQTSSGTKERLYLGGDAYSAPMVYQRDSLNGVWTAYNIGRDYLGIITQIATVSGTLVAEYSYDPWGRLRDPQTLAIYSPGQEPSLFLGRGFTGHEHLPWFSLVNMNARLYDSLVGRFLSPDPFVQAPDFTQNYNRYSYALNNPLKYSDESGEFIISGTVAVVMTIVAVTAGVGFGVWQGSKIADAKGLTGSDRTLTMITGGAIGGLAGFAGSLAGAAVSASIGVGGFLAGAAVGGASGAASGALNGFGMTLLAGGDPIDAFNIGVYQGVVAGLSGALIGGLISGTVSSIQGKSFWDGSEITNEINSHNQASSARSKAEIIRENRERHERAVQRVIKMLQDEGVTDIKREVSFKVEGTRVRLDLVARIDDANVLIEVKSSMTAGYTPNQKIAYPLMLGDKVNITPYGGNAQSIIPQSQIGMPTNNYTFILFKF